MAGGDGDEGAELFPELLSFAGRAQWLISDLLSVSEGVPSVFHDRRFDPVLFDLRHCSSIVLLTASGTSCAVSRFNFFFSFSLGSVLSHLDWNSEFRSSFSPKHGGSSPFIGCLRSMI